MRIAIALAMFVCSATVAQTPSGPSTEGGPVHNGVEVQCDIPPACRRKNVGGSDGAGLCVFTSVEFCAHYQNVPALKRFQDHMRGEPGGGYPSKVDSMIAKYAPGTAYIQHKGGDLEFLRAALRSGRPVAVTYGYSPRYRTAYVAHMATLIHLDDQWAVVLDNNFVGDNQLEWMPPAEFTRRWKLGAGGGWAVVLLSPAAVTPPRRVVCTEQ